MKKNGVIDPSLMSDMATDLVKTGEREERFLDFENNAVHIFQIHELESRPNARFASLQRFGEQGGLPTREAGGFINNREDFIDFMVDQARNNPVEVAAFEVFDPNGRRGFVIQPWIGNTAARSQNNLSFVENFGFSLNDIISQFHSHSTGTGPSKGDAQVSQSLGFKLGIEGGLPIHAITPSGLIWRVSVGFNEIIRRPSKGIHIPYGRITNR